MAAFSSFGGNWITKRGSMAQRLLSPISGFLQARPVLAAVQSRLNWPCRNGCSVVMNAGSNAIATETRRETLNVWPQALRCQPVERNALARFAKTSVKRASVKQEPNGKEE